MVSAACGYDMHRLRFKTKLIQMAMAGAYDRILVEPSGVFDVDEFFDLRYESPLDRWYERGSVIAIVNVVTPDDLSDAERAALQKLRTEREVRKRA